MVEGKCCGLISVCVHSNAEASKGISVGGQVRCLCLSSTMDYKELQAPARLAVSQCEHTVISLVTITPPVFSPIRL